LNALVQLGAPWITPTTISTITGAPIWPQDLFGDEEEERAAAAAAVHSALAFTGGPTAGASQQAGGSLASSSTSLFRDPAMVREVRALVIIMQFDFKAQGHGL
jgi:hypothetical protein